MKLLRRILHNRNVILVLIAIIFILIVYNQLKYSRIWYSTDRLKSVENFLQPDYIVDLIEPNEYSRPQIALNKVNAIVIHYTANPGSTAKSNRDYFNNLQYSKETRASSHFVIGLDGEVIQCIPTKEVAYASNDRNWDSISIESCIENESGEYNHKTYNSLVMTTAWLCAKFNLTSHNVIRHYDITGKICPKYFVEDEDAWNEFLKDVKDELNKAKKIVED